MKRRKRSRIWLEHSDEEFRQIVKNSTCFSDVLKIYGLENKGRNYYTVKDRIIELGLDNSHFTYNKKPNTWSKIPIEDIIIKGLHPKYKTNSLKHRLYKEGIKEHICEECGLENKWNDKELVMHLDHVDGNSNNHKLDNLKILCPNCHSQTDTYAGKNVAHSSSGRTLGLDPRNQGSNP